LKNIPIKKVKGKWQVQFPNKDKYVVENEIDANIISSIAFLEEQVLSARKFKQRLFNEIKNAISVLERNNIKTSLEYLQVLQRHLVSLKKNKKK
jgi:hypothetical protein